MVIITAACERYECAGKKRVEQILMNMDRMRWMPTEPSGQSDCCKHS